MANIQTSLLHRRLKAAVKPPTVLNTELSRGTKGISELDSWWGGRGGGWMKIMFQSTL